MVSTHPSPVSSARHERIPPAFIDEVCGRLLQNKPVRRTLPGGGRLNIDRLLPFLCVYRRDPRREDAGTRAFVNGEAAYLDAPGDAPVRKGLATLVRRIAETAARELGGFLILEIWSSPDSAVPQTIDPDTGEPELPPPAFRILTRLPHRPEGTVATLDFALQRIHVHRQAAAVEIDLQSPAHPPAATPLISAARAAPINCHVLGLEIRPIYRSSTTGELFPAVLRTLRRGVGRALKRAFFTFALNRTTVRPQHHFALGQKRLEKLVWAIDHELTAVSSQFKFLLQVTPVNAERSWQQFRESGFSRTPVFQYRPLDCDPLVLKRRLLAIPTERVEDPTLAHLLRETQDELDRQLNMLADIGTGRFLPGSLQVFGGVERRLLGLAQRVLRDTPRGPATPEAARVSAGQLARRAAAEIRHYRRLSTDFTARAIVTADMYSGLLSTGGNLLIGRETSISAWRADALVQHEVGTHLVTYYNGKAQPLGLLRVGLAGYDGLQEGLAVLSEYLVGGLSAGRLRTLAARVVAVHHMIGGQSFTHTFHHLVEAHGFDPRVAYTIALRVYRGGGLTKDAVYLRGLVEMLEYLRGDGALEPLLVGKLAADHIPVVRELLLRGVLRPPPLRPRYLDRPHVIERLARLRQGLAVTDLVEDRRGDLLP
jgi:uncharacterized protein (TIGR02421 family)